MTAPGEPESAVQLRAADAADSVRLLEWRNDSDAVRYSVTRRRVEQAEHDRWLGARLADPEPRLWIAEQGGMPVGQVRVDVHDGIGTVSVAVAPGHRGRGLGSAILAGLVAEVAGDGAIGELRALVHPENIASLRAFEKVGFRDRKAREDGLVVLDRSGRRSDTGA